MARGSSWFKAKRDKLRKQASWAPDLKHGVHERHKSLLARHETIGAANAKREQLGAMVKRYDGVITVADAGARPQPIGKTKRRFDGATHGNGRREWIGAVYSLDTESVLIRRQR